MGNEVIILWKTRTIQILGGLLLVLSLSFVYPATSYGTPQGQTPKQVTMSTEQFNSLKAIINEQEGKLALLRDKLARLKAISPEQLSELTELKNSLGKANQQLESANNSLAIAKTLTEKQNQSLTALSLQIKKERAVKNRELWQNRLWCVFGGVAIGYAARR